VVARRPSLSGWLYTSTRFAAAKALRTRGQHWLQQAASIDYAGRPQGWGEEQFRAYNTAHYHQPSDEMRDTWDYRGMIQEAEIALAIGRRIADMPEKPKFNPGDEFARKP